MRKVMLDDQCINDVSLWDKNSWEDISDSILCWGRPQNLKNFFYCVEQYTNSDKFTYSYDEV
jgi:hypothetical protein